MTKFVRLCIALVCLCPAISLADTPESTGESLADHYGFAELELYKLSQRAQNLLCGDFNSDGLLDSLIVDNSKSHIELLLQKKQPAAAAADGQNEVNAVPNDARFERKKLAVDRQISALTTGDFNHDGKVDIAYFGTPDRLILRHQPDQGDWTNSGTFRLPEVPAAAWSMAGGDLNSDGRDDLAVLGKSVTYVLYQSDSGQLQPPIQLFNTSEKLGIVQIIDANGDGRNDLTYRSDEEDPPSLCVRFQSARGELGPELAFEVPSTRGIIMQDLDGESGAELLAIDSRTGRVRVWQFKRPTAGEGALAERLTNYGFGGQSRSRDKDVAAGDVDGDGLNDVVMTDGAGAQMLVYRQRPDEGLDLGTTFPGLSGAKDVRLANVDGDPALEVFVLSEDEQTLGVSHMTDGRLSFPEPLPIVVSTEAGVKIEPLAFEILDLDQDGSIEVVYVVKHTKGRSTVSYQLHGLTQTKDGWAPVKFADATHVDLAVTAEPERIRRLDANHDGRFDLMVFLSGDRGTHLYVTDAKGVPTEVQAQGGIQLGKVSPGSMFVGDAKSEAILVAQGKFARNLRLDESNQWRVEDQYNSRESAAKIAGVAALNLDGEPGNEIVLIDSGVKRLRVMRRDENLYQPWKEVELGSLAYESNLVSDLNGDGRSDLLLMGRGQFSVLYADRTEPELTELAAFQTKRKNAYFSDLTCGDLNHDGRLDIAVIDTRERSVEILHFSRDKSLLPGLSFQVFESKSFSSSSNTGNEPRELQIADVTGDGLSDLVLLTHDRLLVYPQDAATEAAATTTTDQKAPE